MGTTHTCLSGLDRETSSTTNRSRNIGLALLQQSTQQYRPDEGGHAELHRAAGAAGAAVAVAGSDRVCVQEGSLEASLRDTVAAVLRGLPRWPDTSAGPKEVESPVLAFVVQVAYEDKLSLLARVFSKIYTPRDVFVYLVDSAMLDPARVRAALPSPLPDNVFVRSAQHATYFYWPKEQVLLDGLAKTLEQHWDFVLHMSESDYPVHSVQWLRRFLGKHRQRSYITLVPKCSADPQQPSSGSWPWWEQRWAVASCESAFEPKEVQGVHYPMQELEGHGFKFANAPEWMILTRELVQYAVQPSLVHFRRMIGMHAATDEIFWGTLVLNIPGFQQSVGHQSWFVQWSQSHGSHPDTLTKQHLPMILQDRQRIFFMRKVTEADSKGLMDELDRLMETPDVNAQDLDVEDSPWDFNATAC
mmetsp:Transcript_43857/g.136544  ORF Transcript_43857/g.136544 Transcript_43857/m.136544 type:complete len:416 (+) Transcript_43857:137-1384(+)